MTSPTDDQQSRRYDYTAEVDAVAAARRAAAEFVVDRFESMDLSGDERAQRLVERLRVVLSELCSNAVEAAPGRWFRVEVSVVADNGSSSARPRGVVCSVTNPFDDEGGDSVRLGLVPDPMAERGRGLAIVDGLADRARIEQSPNSVMVVAELDLNGGS